MESLRVWRFGVALAVVLAMLALGGYMARNTLQPVQGQTGDGSNCYNSRVDQAIHQTEDMMQGR